uniref:Pentapeptide repeat-containing protein n=1 Tax=viral metagenome TaxID=1070528 RepID=A0A6M3K9D6_9ZZZZ
MDNETLKDILAKHAKWLIGESEGTRADLRWADLRWADLRWANLSEATGLLDPVAWMSECFISDERGWIVYRAQQGTYPAPAGWVFEPGSVLTENCHPDRCQDCGCGVNFATLDWVRSNHPTQPIWRCLIPWQYGPGVVVPYNTDGKARCSHLQLLEIVKGRK